MKESPQSAPFILLCRASSRQLIIGIITICAVVFGLRYHAFHHLPTHALGGSERDAGLYLWLTEVFWHRVSEGTFGSAFSSVLNLPGFFPYSLTIAWSDNFLLPSFMSAFLQFLGVSSLPAYNCLLLLAMFLNGFITFVLCLRLTGNTGASIVGGALWMSSSFFSAHLGHPQLQFAFWFPLGTLSLLRAINAQSGWRWSLPGLCVVGAFLTTVYYAVFLAFLLITLLAALFILRPRAITSCLRLSVLAYACAPLLFLIPAALPYLPVQHAFGTRFLHEPYFFSASALSYFSASEFSALFGWTADWSHSEAHLWIGLVPLFLVAASCVFAFSQRHLRTRISAVLVTTALSAVCTVPGLVPGHDLLLNGLCAVGTWLSLLSIVWSLRRLGYLEELGGTSVITNRALLAMCTACALCCVLVSFGPRGYGNTEGIPGLAVYRALYEGFPGFSAVRAIGRIGVLVLFLLSMSASIGLAMLLRRFSLKGVPATGVCFLLVCLGIAEQFHSRYPLEELPHRPTILDGLSQFARSGESAIILPFSGTLTSQGQIAKWGEFARLQINAVRFALPTDVPVVNGYSGQRSKIIREWPAIVQDFPSAQSLRTLSEVVGLRWIVFLAKEGNAAILKSQLAPYQGKVRIVKEDSDGNLLLELLGTRAIDVPGAQILVPAFPSGVMTLELSAIPGADRVSAVVRDLDSHETVTTLSLPADGSWNVYSFRVGSSELRTHPLRLEISSQPTSGAENSPSSNTLFVRRTLYEAGSPES